MLRPPVAQPFALSLVGEAALGRDHEIVRIRMQRLGDLMLVDFGAVGVRGVDVVHSELDGAAQDGLRVLRIVGLADDARPGQAHGAEGRASSARAARRSLSAWRYA